VVFTGKIINYTKQDIHKLREHINSREVEDKLLFAKFNEKPLGAIATRLNVHATLHTMLCQITEETLASDVKEQICSKTDVNMQNTFGYTALHIAAENGHTKAVDLLIQNNADVRKIIHETKFSCLHCAALGGNGKVMESLIKEGAPLESRDKDDRTFLHIAARHGNSSVLDIVSKYKISLLEARDNEGRTPLYTAALAGHTHFVKALLKVGVDVNVQDESGKSPLAVSKEWTIKTILRSLGAGGWTPLMIAAEQGGRKFEQQLKALGCLKCVHEKKQFPGWFQRLVCFHAALTEQSGWVWGGHEPRNLELVDKRMKVMKERDIPDFSAAVGSRVLEYGVHKWEMKVDRVETMWVGIARGIEENGLLGAYPGAAQYSQEDFFMLAFQSNGTFWNYGKLATIEMVYERGYSSGQLIAFELDTFRHTLSVKIDGELAFYASGIDDRGVRPYVCMDYCETVVLISRHSLVAGDADSRPADSVASAFEPAWAWEADSALGTVDSVGQFARKRAADSFPVSALGNRKFSPAGVYSWAFQVKNVHDMWFGVAKGDRERLKRISPKDCGSGEQVLALSAGGLFVNNLGSGSDVELIRPDAGSGFSSGQLVEVVADVGERWLKMRVDGALVRVVSGVDMVDFQPYVCICCSEVVVFQSAACVDTRFAVEKATWRWGAHEQRNLKISGLEEETVTKSSDMPNYSSAVGSEDLDWGIQTWSIKVENVRSMWVGIARNLEESKGLDKDPSSVTGEDVYLVAFGCDGTTLVVGSNPSTDPPSSYEFTSGQTLRLELDTLKHRLRMYIDGAPVSAVTASNVDCRGVRAYVCMDCTGSVTLVERTCRFRATRSMAITDDDWSRGFDNSVWSEEINEFLVKHPLAGLSMRDDRV
jgi:ankyrin repeat protein